MKSLAKPTEGLFKKHNGGGKKGTGGRQTWQTEETCSAKSGPQVYPEN